LERLSHPDFETFRNRITLAGGVTEPSLDHDDFGLNQSKIIVIDSKSLERDAGGKPGSTFPHPALERVQQEGEPVFYPDTRRNKDLEQDNDSKNGDLAL